MQTYKSMQTKAPRKQKHPKTHMHTHPHTHVRESKRRGERKSAARLHYRLLTLCPAALAHRVSRPRGTGSVGDSAGEGTNEKLGANMAAEKLGANMANMAVHTLSRIDTLSRVSTHSLAYRHTLSRIDTLSRVSTHTLAYRVKRAHTLPRAYSPRGPELAPSIIPHTHTRQQKIKIIKRAHTDTLTRSRVK